MNKLSSAEFNDHLLLEPRKHFVNSQFFRKLPSEHIFIYWICAMWEQSFFQSSPKVVLQFIFDVFPEAQAPGWSSLVSQSSPGSTKSSTWLSGSRGNSIFCIWQFFNCFRCMFNNVLIRCQYSFLGHGHFNTYFEKGQLQVQLCEFDELL